jgi:DNA ligase (NAD+)
MTDNIRDHFLSLVAKATDAAQAYYNTSELKMTDEEYDALIEEIEVLAEENGWTEADDLLNAVAAGTGEGGDVVHRTPMLSLSKSATLPSLKNFLAGIRKGVVVEPKFDGLAISATYRNGRLVQVATRGSGTTGEDVTQRASYVKGLPAVIDYKGDLEVRGEVFISNANFHKANLARLGFYYNQWLAKNPSGRKIKLDSLYKVALQNRTLPEGSRKFLRGDKTVFYPDKHIFANERNAVSGALRNENKGYEVIMDFSCYDVLEADSLGSTYSERLAAVEKLNITPATSWMPANLRADSGLSPLEVLEKFGELRDAKKLGYPTDGIVFKADDYAERESIGYGSRSPKWAIAYKYPSLAEETVLRDVEVTIGRTGRLALRALIDPVLVDGTRIEYVSLHNVSWLQQKDLRIGDTVMVRRANDVIPQIDTFVAEKRPATAQRWTPPAVCPKCGGEWDKSNLLWRCQSASCGELNSIIFAAGRDYFDWEGLSEALITRLNDTGKVSNIADVFDLTLEDLTNLDTGRVYGVNHKDKAGEPILLGEKVAQKIYDKIQDSKKKPFANVLAALGIRSLGRTFSRRLVMNYNDMGELFKASVDELRSVEGIGDAKAQLIYDGLRERKDIIVRLAKQGVNMKAPKPAGGANSALKGKKIVVSGSVPGYSRTALQDRIAELGASPSSSVSSSTDFLVADSSASENSKYKKAVSLGIKIISPEDFVKML